jgi:integrase
MIRQKGNAWVVEIYNPATRKKVYVKPRDYGVKTPKTKRDAKALEALALTVDPDQAPTVGEYAATWLRRHPRAQQTSNNYHASAIKPLVKQMAHRCMNEISRGEARDFALANRRAATSARAMWNDAIDDEAVRENPFRNLRLPQSRGRRDIIALTEPQVYALGDKAREIHGLYGDVIAAMVLTASLSGIRAGELMGLRPEDFDRENGACRIERQLRLDGVARPKSGKSRTVVFPPPVWEALDRAHPWRTSPEWLFTNPHGKPFSKTSLHYWWNPVRKAAGHPQLAWHELRHAAATIMLERGVDHAAVAIQLGHQDGGRLVAELYGHPAHDRARDRIRMAWAS